MTQINSSLLPNGLKDLLPPEAEKEAHIINLFMQEFSKFGYARVKPPLVEFEESLLSAGPGKALARNTFRLMDPVSRHMMGVRADTTAQIARISQSRLGDEPRPLRLSYAADVLKVNGSQLRPERQFCQVGCEMIGAGNFQDDVEICLVALSSISQTDMKDLSIDLSIPILVNEIFTAFNVGEDERDVLNKLLQKRDRDGLSDLGTDIAVLLISLLDASGVAADAIEKLTTLDIPKQGQDSVSKLKDVYIGLSEALEIYGLTDIDITIDLIERRGFDYKNGISFTLFSANARGELGRGGRYDISDKEGAVGFTLYMDSIIQATSWVPKGDDKAVTSDTSWKEIKKLQDAGHQVSRARDV